MTDEMAIARRYLTPAWGAFWAWEPGSDTLEWRTGKTIAFREELGQVLARLAPRGLPPFGAVVLLLAATRDNWDKDATESAVLTACMGRDDNAWVQVGILRHVFARLDEIHRLPRELRINPAAKAVLAEIVFEPSEDRTTTSEAAAIVNGLQAGLGEAILSSTLNWEWGPYDATRLLLALACLGQGLRNVDADSLRLRIQTGLDAIPEPAEVDLPVCERVRALLGELDKDEELRGLARAARNLMAAVTLPRPVSEREELPVGGVSDITNRGPLDRLLLSELAHDDLTLAVRVAINEALYLRRESPPKAPVRRRAILLEAGIRSWGVPRVFATAVALALAATTDRHTEVLVWRARGDDVEPVDLTTRAGLVAHLEALETELHPGAALAAFAKELQDFEGAAEPVLVAPDDVLDDAEFRCQLDAVGMPCIHLAGVNRDGRLRLLERTARGNKTIRESRLALEDLFAEPKRVVPSVLDRRRTRDLPAILAIELFPLLLSHHVDPQRMWLVEGFGAVAVTRDRRLMYWTDRSKGARQIADTIPPGALWWSSRQAHRGIVHAVVGYSNPEGQHLLCIDLDRRRCVAHRLQTERGARAFCSHNGALLAIYPRKKVVVLDESSGDAIATLDLPAGMAWQRDRFFRGDDSHRWHALSFDGTSARLELVWEESGLGARRRLLTLFDCDGVDGPVGVTRDGDLLNVSTAEIRRVRHSLSGELRVKLVSRDGHRVALDVPTGQSDRRYTVVDVDTLQAAEYGGDASWLLDRECSKIVQPRSLRRRFTHIYLSNEGDLTLVSRKNRHLRIQYNSQFDCIMLVEAKADRLLGRRPLTFKDARTPPGVGYHLRVATWLDFSRAFLDSRGMLHLKSSDPNVPEATIVLVDGPLSGWCSDGRMWGSPYFIGAHKAASNYVVYQTAIRAFTERLR